MELPPHSHTDATHFRKVNWLPVSDRAESCIANTVFKYWSRIVSSNTNINYSIGIILDHRQHWIYLYKKTGQQLSLFVGMKI